MTGLEILQNLIFFTYSLVAHRTWVSLRAGLWWQHDNNTIYVSPFWYKGAQIEFILQSGALWDICHIIKLYGHVICLSFDIPTEIVGAILPSQYEQSCAWR